MTKVTIKNFQSIAGADFQVDGFTVIVGKNNVGKSAVMRAIKAALSNQAGTEYIRNGTKQTEVDLQFPQSRCAGAKNAKGIEIQWRKGQDKTSYKVNGEPFSALNRSVPKPILEAGFFSMEVGDQKINPLIADQHKEIFLLDKPGSVVTEVMATIYDLNTISKADDLCQKELKSQKSLLKTRDSDLGVIKEDLSKYAGFDAVKAAVESLAAIESKTTALSEEEVILAGMAKDVSDTETLIKALRPVTSVKVPDVIGCEKALSEFAWVAATAESVSNSVQAVKSLRKAGSTTIPDPSNAENLSDECAWIDSALSEMSSLASSVKALSKTSLISVPSVDDGLAIEAAWLLKAEKDLSLIESAVGCLSKASSVGWGAIEGLIITVHKTLEEALSVGKDTEEFMDAARAAKTSRDELKGIESEMSTAEKELKAFGICPACGGALK